MNEHLLTMKSAMAAFFTALAAILGWKGVMLLVWVVTMGLDYLSGTLAACKEKQWSSESARQGLWHKGGMILVVAVAAIADLLVMVTGEYLPLGMHWSGLLLPLVLAWYILTELGSILENAVKLGARAPAGLIRLLKAGVSALEEGLEQEKN